jgi:predicted transcriptional regulator
MNFGRSCRDRIGIIIHILEVAKGGAAKTRIMYKANLGHDQMKQYLTVLTESYFIYYNLHTQTFKTTEKGLRVLEAYNRIEDMMKAQQPSSPPPPQQQQLQVQVQRGGLGQRENY